MSRRPNPKTAGSARDRAQAEAHEHDDFPESSPTVHRRPISSHGQPQAPRWEEDDAASTRRDRPSKSALKRESTALQELGEQLLALPPGKLKALPIPEQLIDAIELAQRISNSRGGLRRQRQYIGKLMRDIDPEPIRDALSANGARHRNEVAAMHAAERWRDRLLDDPGALDAFVEKFPDRGDLAEELTRLIPAARKEKTDQQQGRRYRELYRQLYKLLAEPAGNSQDQHDEENP